MQFRLLESGKMCLKENKKLLKEKKNVRRTLIYRGGFVPKEPAIGEIREVVTLILYNYYTIQYTTE